MKTKPYILSIPLLFVVQLCFAQKASKEDIRSTVSYLKKTTKKTIKFAEQFSEEQLNFKPDEDSWSIIGILEHLVKTDGLYRDILTKALQKSASADEKSDISDEQIIAFVAVRTPTSLRVKTAPSLVPKQDYKDLGVANNDLLKSRKAIYNYLKTTNDELRGYFAKHPSLGNADLFQWYILAAAHTERHYLQMVEVSENPNFPRN